MMTTAPSALPPTEPAPPRAPRLHRSATDRVCCGVCGGIAEYFALDPSLVRVAFVVATLWGGIGVVLYIVLAVILPVDDYVPTGLVAPERGRVLAGSILLVLGAVLLASNLGLAPWLTWNLFWPTVLILVGVAVLLRGPKPREV